MLRSMGLLSRGGGVGDLVTPCPNGDGDCPGYASCTESCGATGYCVSEPDMKKCTKDGSCAGGSTGKLCPCNGGNEDTLCEKCTEKCKDTKWGRGTDYRCVSTGKKLCADGSCKETCSCEGSGDCYSCTEKCDDEECVPSGKKKCDDGSCVDIFDSCPEGDGCDSPCYELVSSGSDDTKECKIKEGYIESCGTTCCPTMYDSTEAMQCCPEEGGSVLPGACCRASEGCGKLGDANICTETGATCPPPDYKICTATSIVGTDSNICCPSTATCAGALIAVCGTKRRCNPYCDSWVTGGGGYGGSATYIYLCCEDDETCVTKEISGREFKLCLKTSCGDDEFVCPGTPPLAEMNVCCKNNLETCFSPMFGRPRCLPKL